MSITLRRANTHYEYQQRPGDPCVLEGRPIRFGSRWQFLGRYATAKEARAALLKLGKTVEDKSE